MKLNLFLLTIILIVSCTTSTSNFATNANAKSSSSSSIDSSINSSVGDSLLLLANYVTNFSFTNIANNNQLDRVVSDLNLFTSQNGIKIDWTSLDTQYISKTGKVKRDSLWHSVELYANFVLGSNAFSKKFNLNVVAIPTSGNYALGFANNFMFSQIKGNNVSQDSVVSDLNLLYGNDSVFITWNSNIDSVISDSGKVVRAKDKITATLTAYISDINNNNDSVHFYLTVPKKEPPKLPNLLQLTFTTKSYNGTFSPKHVMAAWIDDEQGNVVKTLGRWAQNFVSKLSWHSLSGVDVDVKTSATMRNHGNVVPPTWNLQDKNGNKIKAGNYKLYIEFNETNSVSQHKLSVSDINITDTVIFVNKDETSYIYNINLK